MSNNNYLNQIAYETYKIEQRKLVSAATLTSLGLELHQ